jgi:hypothetical protein
MKATKLLGRKRGRVKKMKLKLETSAWEGERKTTVGSPIRGRRQSAISNQQSAISNQQSAIRGWPRLPGGSGVKRLKL